MRRGTRSPSEAKTEHHKAVTPTPQAHIYIVTHFRFVLLRRDGKEVVYLFEENLSWSQRLARELIAKTKVVECYLIPLLEHSDFPKPKLREFLEQWFFATLQGERPEDVQDRAARLGINPATRDGELKQRIARAMSEEYLNIRKEVHSYGGEGP